MESSIAQKKAELTVSESEIETLVKSVKYWKSEKDRERFLLAKEATSKARYAAVEEKFNTFAGELRTAKNKLLSIEKALQACNHRLQKLNIQLSYCKISSPFSGIVTKRSVDPGVLAVPGKHLMIIEDISCRKLVFDIPQQDLSLIKEGNLIVYETDKGKGKATLGHIFPALDKARLCRAEASICHLARKNLKIGMQLPVAVIYASSNDALTLIPVESLMDESKDSAHVYVVESDKLKRKKVKIWGVDNELAGVKGIEPGESVVTSSYLNWINLSEGLKVETVQ
jgi:RND family efflux transporter MFP subunit